MFPNDPNIPRTPPALLTITEPEVAAALEEVRAVGLRADFPVATMCRALEHEQQVAQQVAATRYGDEYLRLGDTITDRVARLCTDYLGFVGEDQSAYANTARLLAFAMFHNPNPRPDTTVPMWDMSGWPFNHIDWQAAADELHEQSLFDVDVYIVDGYAFRRQWTTEEEYANGDTFFM